jgi:hypothetical protein
MITNHDASNGNSYPPPAPSLDERVAQLEPAKPFIDHPHRYPSNKAYTEALNAYDDWLDDRDWWLEARSWLDGIDGARLRSLYSALAERCELPLDAAGMRELKRRTGCRSAVLLERLLERLVRLQLARIEDRDDVPMVVRKIPAIGSTPGARDEKGGRRGQRRPVTASSLRQGLYK